MERIRQLAIRNVFGVLLTSLLVFLDQYTKSLAVKYLKNSTSIVLIEGILELQYAENRGAAFGIFQNKQLGLVIVSGIILLVVLVLFETTPYKKRLLPLQLVYILLIAGAIGNMIDRIRLNYVVDFIYIRVINFPNFNLADMCVTGACILLLLLVIFFYKDGEQLTFLGKNRNFLTSKDSDLENNFDPESNSDLRKDFDS